MRTQLCVVTSVTILIVLSNCDSDVSDPSSARVFPLLPPYQGVDFLQNWVSLATVRNGVAALTSSTITLMGINLMWIVLHAVFWDGPASTIQDVLDSLQSPGVKVELSSEEAKRRSDQKYQKPYPEAYYQTHYSEGQFSNQDNAQDRVDAVNTLINSFRNELSPVKFWNFFADPDKSTRNLWLNIGFTAGSHLMYILPTFFGTVDLPAIRSDFPVLKNTPENESLRLWNRLFCPQCILNTVLANTVVWIGKTLWWSFMSTIPDVVGFGPDENFPRMLQHKEVDNGIVISFVNKFMENIYTML